MRWTGQNGLVSFLKFRYIPRPVVGARSVSARQVSSPCDEGRACYGPNALDFGGARFGKSKLAERLASQRSPVISVATAEARDAEMAVRIGQHRRRRSPDWRTVEEPLDLAAAIDANGQSTGTLLVECVTLWLSNLLLHDPRPPTEQIRRSVDGTIAAARRATADVVWVSNEVGSGIVPDNPLAREFRDLLGEVNQQLAAASDHVTLCVAGIASKLK